MEYIIITLLAIAATTCIVYLLANKVFAVRLRLKSLVLCAACALFLSLVLPRIIVSFVGLAGTVGFLALFAVIFAYFVAYYDDPNDLQPAGNAAPAPLRLSDEQPASSAAGDPQVRAASHEIADSNIEPAIEFAPVNTEYGYQAPSEPLDASAAARMEDIYTADVDELPPIAVVTEEITDETESAEPATAPVDEASFTPDEPIEQPEIQPPLDPLSGQLYSEPEPETDDEAIIEAEIVVASDFEPPAPPAAEPECEPTNALPPLAIEAAELEPIVEAEQAAAISQDESEPSTVPELGILLESFAATELEVDPALESSDDDLVTLEHEAALETSTEQSATFDVKPDDDSVTEPELNLAQAEPLPTEGEGSAAAAADDEPLPEESEVTTTVAEPASTSLEDLLDFAFTQKDRDNLTLALDTFRRAYRLYRDSEAGPLLVIEIAGLLKAKGAYDEAVTILSDGRSLTALQQNSLLDQEFVTTIAYLRIVKNTLMQNRIGFVPFQRIPADIAKEIDDEFREWRNLA